MQAQPLANGLTGQTDWKTIDWKEQNRLVRNLRQRIFRATQAGDWKKVRSLQRIMLRSRANVLLSVRRVSQVNQGKHTPGVDKVVVKTPAERGKLADDILIFTPWRAQPARRVYIPKANGKQRPLGIPTIRDRAMQAIVKNALEPSWEARFERSSYGFRPGRGCHDAIEAIFIKCRGNSHKKWILDADVKGAFDNISHDFLMRTIGDVPGKALIHQWLKAGYMEMGSYHDTESGTPQGGVISPLLANIALHGMEEALNIRWSSRGYNLSTRAVVRYADDFCVFCETKEDAEICQTILTEWLKQRGLEFSAEKTHIVHLTEGVDFLSFNIRQYPSRNTKTGWKLLIKPSRKAVQRMRNRLRDELKALHGHNHLDVIKRLNPIIRGQANYHRIAVAKRTFNKLDYFLTYRLIRFVKRLHPTKPKYWWQPQYFGKLHPSRNDQWVFGDKKSKAYLLKYSWFPIQRHILVRGTASPDDPSLRHYWLQRELQKVKTLKPVMRELAQKQKGICPVCGENLFNEEDFEQHHIVAQVQCGPNTPDNKLLVHTECHRQLTAVQRQQGLFLRRK
jgi:RNA-directed DNA polymerase